MNIRFARLFEIRFLHHYYKGRSSSDLRLVPTMPTLRILNRYRMLVRQQADGIVVLAPLANGTNDKLQFPIALDEGFRLVFRLKLTTPYFLNFTNLPFKKPVITHLKPLKTGYYFSNLQKNDLQLTSPTQNLQLLSKKAGSPVSEEDQLPFWTESLRVSLDPPANSLDVVIKDSGGTDVYTENTSTTGPFGEFAPEKPPSLPPGVYQLIVDGGTPLPVYIDDEIYHAPPFGVVEIYHNATVDDDYKIIQPGTSDTFSFQSYHLLFDARSTIWRYRFPAGLTGVASITKGATNFTAVAADKLFESPGAIKLSDEYQSVQMTKNSISKNIPNPDITTVKPDVVTGNVYSEVYL